MFVKEPDDVRSRMLLLTIRTVSAARFFGGIDGLAASPLAEACSVGFSRNTALRTSASGTIFDSQASRKAIAMFLGLNGLRMIFSAKIGTRLTSPSLVTSLRD